MPDGISCRSGDVICVTWASAESVLYGGIVLGQGSGANELIFKKEHITRIPTRVERPEMDFIDDFTPILFQGVPDSNSLVTG